MIQDYTDNVTMPENAGPTVLAGRYRIVRQLGQGGMGSVWLAEDTKLDNRPIAVKMLPSILVSNKRAYAQVKAEALVSLKLSHSNIATVRGFEEDNGNPFLVMDYIDGQTLDDYLAEKGKLTEDETIRLLKPVAAALDYAHSQGVVHRDVKPGNVMIDKSGHPYVLDFGIAREIQETMTRVTGKLSSGTLLYMSPEQLHGAAPKPMQDVYSFAAMAYECLKGEPPFSRGQIEYQIEHDAPEPLGPQFARCGPGVMSGLAKTAERRPTTCVAVLVARGERATDSAASVAPEEHERGQQKLHANEDTQEKGTGSNRRRWWCLALPASLVAVGVACGIVGLSEPKIERRKGPKAGSCAGEQTTIVLPGGATMEMVWCPPGSFDMGSPSAEWEHGDNEALHRVTLTQGFWMGMYEVTQAQWESVMGRKWCGLLANNPSGFKGADRPVENVSWHDCQMFIEKVNASLIGSFKVSLPTEAQWEYACRAGSTTPYSFGSSLNGDKANCDGNYPYGTTVKGKHRRETAPVGSYAPNAWGLYDMHGNVLEWCVDCYDRDFYTKVSAKVDPCCVSGTFRVSRGGCCFSYALFCRSAFRYWFVPGFRFNDLGFRLVCSAGPRR